eukprot:m.783197 g.783197  ORF g.783197 m.783197 type:complete len:81 (-) comp23293_c0_seq4:4211-4453(-)
MDCACAWTCIGCSSTNLLRSQVLFSPRRTSIFFAHAVIFFAHAVPDTAEAHACVRVRVYECDPVSFTTHTLSSCAGVVAA